MGPHHEPAALGGPGPATATQEETGLEFQSHGWEGPSSETSFQAEGEEATPFPPGSAVQAWIPSETSPRKAFWLCTTSIGVRHLSA